MEKIVAVVLAHNEEKYLPRTLRILNWHKFFGRIHEIIVVDDGSRDRTKEIAKKKGAIVVSNPYNLGKRESFVNGALKAKELNATIMLNFDADLVHLPKKTLNAMIQGIRNGNNMVIAQQMERGFSLTQPLKQKLGLIFHTTIEKRSNAQRAIKMSALEPLFRGNKKWVKMLKGKIRGQEKLVNYYKNNHQERLEELKSERNNWGLEATLDTLITKSDFIPSKVYTEKPFRRSNLIDSKKFSEYTDRSQIIEDAQLIAVRKTERIIKARKRLAKIKRNQRKRK